MSLGDALVETRPRETSGSRSANRFDFQKSWALCRLLELHKSGEDYLIIFDYHDDVLVLDSSSNPTQIDFYQIKTKQGGHWTQQDLIRRVRGARGPLPSILGKMLGNKLNFPDYTRSLNLVSTRGFKLSVTGRASSIVEDVCLKELKSSELKAILAALRAEHSLTCDPDCAGCTRLSVTSLSLGDHDTHAMGVLGRFLHELYPGQKVCLPAVYQSLCDEIRRKTHVERRPKVFSQLREERAISRDGFARLLHDVKPATEFELGLSQAIHQLQSEGMAFDEVKRIGDACRLYEVERMDSTEVVICRARVLVAKEVLRIQGDGSMPGRLTDAIALVTAGVEKRTKLLASATSEHYRSAMILMALYGF